MARRSSVVALDHPDMLPGFARPEQRDAVPLAERVNDASGNSVPLILAHGLVAGITPEIVRHLVPHDLGIELVAGRIDTTQREHVAAPVGAGESAALDADTEKSEVPPPKSPMNTIRSSPGCSDSSKVSAAATGSYWNQIFLKPALRAAFSRRCSAAASLAASCENTTGRPRTTLSTGQPT